MTPIFSFLPLLEWQAQLAFAHNTYQRRLKVHPWAEPALIHFMQLPPDPPASAGHLPSPCLEVSGFMNLPIPIPIIVMEKCF